MNLDAWGDALKLETRAQLARDPYGSVPIKLWNDAKLVLHQVAADIGVFTHIPAAEPVAAPIAGPGSTSA